MSQQKRDLGIYEKYDNKYVIFTNYEYIILLKESVEPNVFIPNCPCSFSCGYNITIDEFKELIGEYKFDDGYNSFQKAVLQEKNKFHI